MNWLYKVNDRDKSIDNIVHHHELTSSSPHVNVITLWRNNVLVLDTSLSPSHHEAVDYDIPLAQIYTEVNYVHKVIHTNTIVLEIGEGRTPFAVHLSFPNFVYMHGCETICRNISLIIL